MSNDLPEPLTPADCDLRTFEWMKLDINRLLTSETWILGTAEECKAAVTLWCEAWRQVPSASLPDDDRMLAHLSRAGSAWKKVREMVMRSWVKCSDGRLYHPVVAEKAREAWAEKLAQKARTEAARLAKLAKRHGHIVCEVNPQMHVTTSVTDLVTSSVTEIVTASRGDKRRGEEIREERKKEPPIAPEPEPIAVQPAGRRGVGDGQDFDRFWNAYPRKVGKGQARRAWLAAIRKAKPERIIDAVKAQRFDLREQYQPHPATWLNGERWLDQAQTGDSVLRAVGLTGDGLMMQPDPAWSLLQ